MSIQYNFTSLFYIRNNNSSLIKKIIMTMKYTLMKNNQVIMIIRNKNVSLRAVNAAIKCYIKMLTHRHLTMRNVLERTNNVKLLDFKSLSTLSNQ